MTMAATQDYLDHIGRWRAERLERLKAEDGWLNLVGRWDLAPGITTLGSDPASDIVLPGGPAHIGTVTLGDDGIVVFTPRDSAPIRITPDAKVPPRVDAGRFLFEMQEETGWPTWLIFAGVHGHITALMVQNMGPQDAAAICERAARRMRGFAPCRLAPGGPYSMAVKGDAIGQQAARENHRPRAAGRSAAGFGRRRRLYCQGRRDERRARHR